MRIRTIKPEFFLHDGLADLERETGLPIRLAFIGLWCAADREGRFRWEPRRLKLQILPYDDHVDFSRVLHALATRGYLVKYRVGDRWFGVIPSFTRHQIINNRERESDIPDVLGADEVANEDLTRAPRVPDACPTRPSLPFPSGSSGISPLVTSYTEDEEEKTRARAEAEDLPTEPPPGFPPTATAAAAQAGAWGVTPAIAERAWTLAASRGWRDARDVRIRSWPHYVAHCQGRERDREAETALRRPVKAKPESKQIQEAIRLPMLTP